MYVYTTGLKWLSVHTHTWVTEILEGLKKQVSGWTSRNNSQSHRMQMVASIVGCCLVSKLCWTLLWLCGLSLPGSSVRVISQARILEWLSFPSPEDLPDLGIEAMSAVLAYSCWNEDAGNLLAVVARSEPCCSWYGPHQQKMCFILWLSSHFLSSEFISLSLSLSLSLTHTHTHTHKCLSWWNLNHTGTSSVSSSGKYSSYFSRLCCTLEKDPNRGWVDQSTISIFFNGVLIATHFSFSYFFSFLLLFVSVIRYCHGFYLAITLFWMYKLFAEKLCGGMRVAWAGAAARVSLWAPSQDISHTAPTCSRGTSPSLGQTRQRNAVSVSVSIYISVTFQIVNLSLVLLLADSYLL